MLFLPATLLALAAQTSIAITQSGLHVQCIDAQVGDRQVQTPFGLLRTPSDPVVEIADGSNQVADFRKLHQQGITDDETWLQDLSTAGQLEELARACLEILAQQPQSIFPYTFLESWGKKIDPTPPQLPYRKRVSWLWEQASGKDFTKAVLAGAFLLEEISYSSEPDNDRIIRIADLRKALRSKSVVRRRVAAHIAGRQQEFSLRETLMLASLTDPVEAARDAAAEGLSGIHPHSARQYWVRNLARGTSYARVAAAWNLGHYGGADGLQALVHVLATWNHKVGQRFRFADRSVWLVSDPDRSALDIAGYNPEQEEVDFRHLNPDLEFLDLGSTFKVTRYGESFRDVLLEALDTWAGETTHRDVDAWLKYYLEEWLPSRP